jgi:UDP:flavonoid glycosyltransferase YjiC (YdhE family)
MQVCGDAPLDATAAMFRPPAPLSTFLDYPNPPPIYIGFGAHDIPDPISFTELVYDAAKASGRRILLDRGLADLGSGVEGKPENVCLIGNCPHAWLFPKCSAAIHHGGAGTTAAALRAGIPSLVVRSYL